jgi:hypothetical protein
MVTQELLDNIAERYRQGQKRADIKDTLMAEGWEDIDIDAAISQLQKAGLQQIPIVGKVMKIYNEIDEKTSRMPPRMVLTSLLFCLLLVFAVGAILFFVLDPLGTRAGPRDEQRKTDFIQIRTALTKYGREKKQYPKSLNELVPTYVFHLPVDPKTGNQYQYILHKETNNYQLCISFELQIPQCVASSDTSTIPVVTPSL